MRKLVGSNDQRLRAEITDRLIDACSGLALLHNRKTAVPTEVLDDWRQMLNRAELMLQSIVFCTASAEEDAA
jgi:hypothetical protein